eukprot:CAMPEP_0117546708 /NCGR_PEP_ID=MMETSP0784-20121206/46745_1 /TAXON_ID=39447 /ORGANISM="" /LENGTH=440 /DNA_ID=CAMNT_0005343585 /DNA_START=146 /DNA_END=1468 /DNA_ORIENTATION=+
MGSGVGGDHVHLSDRHRANNSVSGGGKADKHVFDEHPVRGTDNSSIKDRRKQFEFGHGIEEHLLDGHSGLGSGSECGSEDRRVWMANMDQFISTMGLWVRGPYSGRYDETCQPAAATKEKWASYKQFHNDCSKKRECLQKRALVWKCGAGDFCGGLGDNIRGLAFTVYAAIQSQRPLYIVWNRLGQDILNFFASDGMDLTPPSDLHLDTCKTRTFIDGGDGGELINSLSTNGNVHDAHCVTWTNNFPINHFFSQKNGTELQQHLPWATHIKPQYSVGCAMRFLFKPAELTHKDRINVLELPEHFSVIHYRVGDGEFGDAGNPAAYTEPIKKALRCATAKNISNVLFLCANEVAKAAARALKKEVGVNVIECAGVARHIDHDSSKLQPDEFRSSVWSEFVAAQQAEHLIALGRFSGLTLWAASMGFMPLDNIIDGNSCEVS